MKFLIGFRKLSITLLTTVLLTTFLLTGHVEGSDYAKAISAMVVAYVSANIGEHITNLAKDYINKLKEK